MAIVVVNTDLVVYVRSQNGGLILIQCVLQVVQINKNNIIYHRDRNRINPCNFSFLVLLYSIEIYNLNSVYLKLKR